MTGNIIITSYNIWNKVETFGILLIDGQNGNPIKYTNISNVAFISGLYPSYQDLTFTLLLREKS